MRTTRATSLLLGMLFVAAACAVAFGADPIRHAIRFPDLPGYRTLACDFHMHTVFSDGEVWPAVRVAEAWREGLDVIAITDHIEYLPHKDDVSTKLGRAYELAAGAAKAHDVLLISGAEITRDTPPGHFNALFASDIKALDTPDFLEAIKRANDQGAVVCWNHQGWKGEEQGRWMDVHTTMYQNKWLHGMEVCNGDEYYPMAHAWCLEKNLTMFGGSDIHEPDLRSKCTSADHRTMTLVFAKERSLEAVKEALREGRTVVWYHEQLIGRKEWLEPLFAACVQMAPPHYRAGKNVFVKLTNCCEADVHLERVGPIGPPALKLPAGTACLVKITLDDPNAPARLEYTAKNLLVAPGRGLSVTFDVPAP